MEKKDMYTLKELYGELDIPLAELGRRAGVSEVTVAKIRDGKSARRSTVNSLLRTFSEIYGVKLSIDNVKDVLIGDKLAKSNAPVAEQATTPHVPPSMPYEASAISSPQNRPTMAKEGIEGSRTRTYTTASDIPADWTLCSDFFEMYGIAETSSRRWLNNGLQGEIFEFEERNRPGRMSKFRYFTPEQQRKAFESLKRHGKYEYILASKFAELHGVKPSAFEDHMKMGLGPGLIGMSTDTIPERDRVKFEERPKPGRKGEKERYLTPEQQAAAIEFWKRHNVAFTLPESKQQQESE